MDNIEYHNDELSVLECDIGSNVENSANMEVMEENIQDRNYTEQLRPQKRNRQVDENEIWTVMTRKGKRFARAEGSHESLRVVEDKFEISITSTEKLPKQFKLAKILKMENIPDIIRIKYINAYKVVVYFNNENSAEKLMESTYFKENGYKCQKTLEVNFTYGVIKDIDLDSTEEEILNSISCQIDVIAVKRLKRRNSINGQWEPSETVHVCFRGSSLPSYVYIFDTKVLISPYLYPVTQCSRCWRYGHTVKTCPSNKVICPKCGEFHANCGTTMYRCNNCHGKHMALARICPMYIKEKRIRELMAEFNCSYKKALTMYIPPEPIQRHQYLRKSHMTEVQNTSMESINPTCSPSTRINSSYADALKKPVEVAEKSNKNIRNKKQNKQKSKSSIQEERNSFWESCSESEIENIDQSQTEDTAKKKNKTTWKFVFKQLAEIMWNKNLTLEEKIKSSSKIIFESITLILLHYLHDLPFFSQIKSWITADFKT